MKKLVFTFVLIIFNQIFIKFWHFREKMFILVIFAKNRKGFPSELNQVEVAPNEIKIFQINNNDIQFIYFKNNKKKSKFNLNF